MNEPNDTPRPPADATLSRKGEYEDPHYHDDDELPDEDPTGPPRPPAGRRIPPRRTHRDDD
jgi:hypothetical protein